MINVSIAYILLFDPLRDGMNELYILSAYATPNMLSWYMKNIEQRTTSVSYTHLTLPTKA